MTTGTLELLLKEGPGSEGEHLSVSNDRVYDALNRGPEGLEGVVEKEAASRGWRLKPAAYQELKLLSMRVVDEGIPSEPVEIPARLDRPGGERRPDPSAGPAAGAANDDFMDAIRSDQFLWVSSNNPIEAMGKIRRAASELAVACYSWQEDRGFQPPLPWCGNGSRMDVETALRAIHPDQHEDGGELVVFQHIEALLYQQGMPGPLLPSFLTLVESIREVQASTRVLVLTASEHGSNVPQPLIDIFCHMTLNSERVPTPTLDRVMQRDLTAMARNGEIAPLYDVDGLIGQIVEVLVGGWNVLLVGPPGGGKTALVAELARLLVEGRLPLLQGRRVVEISVDTFAAGTQLRGSLEERVKNLTAEIRGHKHELIIFMDEAHRLVDDPTAHEAVQGLKGALARAEFPLVAATTDTEVVHLERDRALSSRFKKISVPAPDRERLSGILESVRPVLSKIHGVTVLKEAAEAALALTQDAAPGGEGQPRRAIQLLEMASARARVAGAREVSAAHVKEVEGKSGGHWDEAAHLLDLPDRLKQCVRFQDEVVDAVARAVTASITTIVPRRRPFSILLLGPSGVGKTSLAARLAEEAFGGADALHLFPLEQYGDQHSGTNLFGAPRSYIGSDQPSPLVLAAQRRPEAVFLFDELEKAHSETPARLLNILERGYFEDPTGARASFARGVFVFTSNVLLEVPDVTTEEDLRERAKQAFRDHAFEQASLGSSKGEGISVPFLNRIDRLFLFRPLEAEQVAQIAQERLDSELQPYQERGVAVDCSDPSVRVYFAGPYARDEGARPGVRKVEDLISQLQFWLAAERVQPPAQVRTRYDPDSRKIIFARGG
jgi:ATP-dependent Clp protease ATP-binding subunit ClpA